MLDTVDDERGSGPEAEAHALFEEARRRTRRRRRRRAVITAALVVAGAAVALLWARDRPHRPAPARDRAAVGHPAQRTKLFVQLLTTNEPLAVVDPQSGKARVVRRLETVGGDFMDRVHVTGGRVVWNGVRGAYAIDTDLRGSPQLLARPNVGWSYFVPSATPGRVWFTFRERDQRTQLVEMTVRGRVTDRVDVRRPCRGVVLRALDRALLCQDADHDRLLVVDRRSGSVLTHVPGVFPFATHRSVVASCDYDCGSLHLTDIATRRSRDVLPPDGFRYVEGYDGEFSLDGRLLAVGVKPTRGGTGGVALVDVRRGSARVIPGSRLAAYRRFAWSSSGELFFPVGRGRIMAFRPGDERARRLAVDLRHRILDIAAN